MSRKLHDESLADDLPQYEVPHEATYPTAKTPLKTIRVRDKIVEFDDDRKDVFLAELQRTGRLYQAAAVAGVQRQTVAIHRRSFPEFEDAVQEALAAYQDQVRSVIQRRAIEGELVPIIGRVGRDVDGIIGYRRQYSDRLLEMEAKRVDHEYRDRSALDVNVAGGVLVVGMSATQEQWLAANEGQKLPADPLEGLPGVSQALIEGVGRKVAHEEDDA